MSEENLYCKKCLKLVKTVSMTNKKEVSFVCPICGFLSEWKLKGIFVLGNTSTGLYFDSYRGNKPLWTTDMEKACHYHVKEIALRCQHRLWTQCQYVHLIEL